MLTRLLAEVLCCCVYHTLFWVLYFSFFLVIIYGVYQVADPVFYLQLLPFFPGVPGKGGAIDGPAPVAVDGMLFVNSGYGMFGQMPGNVLLAFEVNR